jgi:hypothetical protein
VSRRSRRRADAGRQAGVRGEADVRGEAGARGKADARGEPDAGRKPGGPLSSLGVQLVLLAAVFGLAVLVAELFGAANLGVAFGVGQIAFAVALVYLLLRH